MADQIRVGLIGAGFVGNIHARAYRRIRDLDMDISAVAAVPLAQAEELARQYGIADAYDDYRRILKRSDINLVDLCVPNHLHERFAIEAARAGKHIVCEKPFTGYFGGPGAATPVGVTSKDLMLKEALKSTDRMIAAAEQYGVRLMYAENWLYCPAVQKALRLASASKGTILEIRAQESHSGSHAGYAKTWEQAGGGALMRLAPHPIGTAIYFKEQEGIRREGKAIRVEAVTAEVGDMSKMAAFQSEANHWLVADWLAGFTPPDDAHCRLLSLRPDSQPLAAPDGRPTWFLSGPEGGLSAGEEAAAIARGFAPVTLGTRVLRAETAPLAALARLTQG